MKAHVTVMPKSQVLDPQGKAVLRGLHSLGFSQVSDVRQGKVFTITLDDTLANPEAVLADMAKALLANPIMDVFHIEIVKDPA